MSKRYDAIKAIRDRLAQISTSNGYNTNAGALIFINEEAVLDDGDPDEAVAIVVGPDSPRDSQGEKVVSDIPVEVQALVRASIEEPMLSAENVVEDIKRAIEQEDRTLGGLLVSLGLERGTTRVIDREPGATVVGVGVLYTMTLAEAWGQP